MPRRIAYARHRAMILEEFRQLAAFAGGNWTEAEMRILAAAVAVSALAGIVWHDLRRWEIDPWFCAAAATAGAVFADLEGDWPGSLLGGAAGLTMALLISRVKPSALGQGDRFLYALCGFLVGINGLPAWAVANAALGMAFTFCSARRRGRPFRRCAIPAALPACPPAGLLLLF